MLKSLIIGTLLSILVSVIITKVFEVYSLDIYTKVATVGSSFLFIFTCVVYNWYNNDAKSLIFNRNTVFGCTITCVTFGLADLRSSMLFLCVLSLQYIYVNTDWLLTKKLVNLVLLLTLVRSLTTILFDDLIEIGIHKSK
jgi:hypothetical protein